MHMQIIIRKETKVTKNGIQVEWMAWEKQTMTKCYRGCVCAHTSAKI